MKEVQTEVDTLKALLKTKEKKDKLEARLEAQIRKKDSMFLSNSMRSRGGYRHQNVTLSNSSR